VRTLEWRTIDKGGWPDGPWRDEPDKKQWRDPATGLACLVVRSEHSGALCGYVGVTPGHPLYGRGYDDADVSVHGGLTFAGACRPGGDESVGICHRPEPGEPDHVWWLGFDCAHLFDLAPGMTRYMSVPDTVYRDLAYVEEQVTGLAAQLINPARESTVPEDYMTDGPWEVG
jgi:hypothetical protein